MRAPEVDLSVLGKEIDPYHLFIQSVPLMVDQARMQRFAAATDTGNGMWHSYRGFPVLAAGFAVYTHGQNFSSSLIVTGNLKTSPAKEKVCAEKRMLGRLKKQGMTQLIGLVVASTTDRDEIQDVLDRPHATLLPCDACTERFEKDTHVADDMPVVTTGLEEDNYQTTTPAELRNFYAGSPMKPLAYTTVAHMNSGWNNRLGLYEDWVSQLPGDELYYPSRAVLARVAIGIQPEAIDGGHDVPVLEVPSLLERSN